MLWKYNIFDDVFHDLLIKCRRWIHCMLWNLVWKISLKVVFKQCTYIVPHHTRERRWMEHDFRSSVLNSYSSITLLIALMMKQKEILTKQMAQQLSLKSVACSFEKRRLKYGCILQVHEKMSHRKTSRPVLCPT